MNSQTSFDKPLLTTILALALLGLAFGPMAPAQGVGGGSRPPAVGGGGSSSGGSGGPAVGGNSGTGVGGQDKPHKGAGYGGPAGTGKPGSFTPAGTGDPGAKAPPGSGGNGGTGTPGGGAGGGGGLPGGGNGGGINPPGTGFNPPGGGRPGGGAPAPRPRGTGPLGTSAAIDAWQNWWRLNEAHYLDVERRYRERNAAKEQSPDIFVGEADGNAAKPTVGGSELVKKKTGPFLKKMLEHEYFAVRSEAVLAIAKIGGAENVSLIVPMTKDKNLDVRKAAIVALGIIQSPKALPYLKAVFRDPLSQNVERAYAAVAMGLIGDRSSTKLLVDSLAGGRRVHEVDAAALYALGLLDNNRARVNLEYYVLRSGNDDRLRAVAVEALAHGESLEVLDTLQAAFKDEDVRVRRSAAIGLGHLDFSSPYRAELEQLRREMDEFDGDGGISVRAEEEIDNYLGRLRTKVEADEHRLDMIRRGVVEMLGQRGLEDSDVMVRNFSAIALGEIGTAGARRFLLNELNGVALDSTQAFCALGLGISGENREVAEELRRRLARRKLDQNSRAAVLLALGLQDDKRSAPAAMKHLRTRSHEAVASFAGIALGLLGERKATPVLRKILLGKSRPELKRSMGLALGLMGETAIIDDLAKALTRRGSVSSKIQWAAAMSGINDDRALDALITAARQRRVKNEVMAALVRAVGIIGERGDRPVLSPYFRHLNYLTGVVPLNEIALL